MPLKKSTGNMYSFVTHTWNPVRGKCGYCCSYCYVNKWGRNTNPLRLIESELNTDLGKNNYIFVCSGCDLFHNEVKMDWIEDVITASEVNGKNNSYLWHTKNPERALEFQVRFGDRDMLCVTIETNRFFDEFEISKAPNPVKRFNALYRWKKPWMLTIEPVIDFDNEDFVSLIKATGNMPVQVNIGADSCGSGLPEPSMEKLEALIEALAPHTKIHLKKNLRRLLPEHELYGRNNA